MDTLSAEQAARLLHVNVKRVQRLARLGRLPGRRVGRRWLFPRVELEALLGRDRPAADAEPAGAIELSARNQLRARVVSVVAEGVMAEVRLLIGDQELTSVITRRSVERLGLRAGDAVYAVIKSTEVMIGKGRETA
jgi:molybdate transport system regulatory protein